MASYLVVTTAAGAHPIRYPSEKEAESALKDAADALAGPQATKLVRIGVRLALPPEQVRSLAVVPSRRRRHIVRFWRNHIEDRPDIPDDKSRTSVAPWSEAIKNIGGLVAVAIGLFVILLVALAALFLIKFAHADQTVTATIATSAFGVVSAIVGAYFGVKVGTDKAGKATDAVIQATDTVIRAAAYADPRDAAKVIGDQAADDS